MPPSTPDDTSTLERLRRKLYAPEAPASFPEPALRPAAPEAPVAGQEGWAPPAVPSAPKKKVSYAALFLGIAGAFFVLALMVAAYFLVFGGRSVSTDRIDIQIDGPSSISSGDIMTVLVAVENGNPVPVQETMLMLAFPDTTRSAADQSVPFTRYEDTLGTVAPGETATRSVQAMVFGAEGERVRVPVTFEYRVEGSNATFVKEAEYEVTITSSPLSVRAEAVSEVSVGQPLVFAVTVRSNAQAPLENVAVFAQYPFGFASVRGEGPLFEVGTLAPGEERTLTVQGTLSGEDADERVFRFTAGTTQGESPSALAVSYATALAPVTLAKPFLATTLSINRDTGANPVIDAGVPVQGSLSWLNTLATPVLDGQISVALSGSALDTASVSAYGGYYRSSDTTILYSRETDASLASLAPGTSGNGTFSFKTKPTAELAGTKNPAITATVSVVGRRVGERNVPESVSSSVVRTIKVGTELTLAARALYSTGPFKNTGPWPPVADQETTYTITLDLANSVNTVADTVVSGVLPTYVRFVSGSDGSVSYNPATRTVSWKAGDVEAGTGYGTPRKAASFQVALLPSVSQRGTSPILVSSLTAAGVDRFTQKQLTLTAPEVTTRITNDPAYMQGKAEVR